MVSLICKKLEKNHTETEIADMLEEDIDMVRKICEVAKESTPDYDVEEESVIV